MQVTFNPNNSGTVQYSNSASVAGISPTGVIVTDEGTANFDIRSGTPNLLIDKEFVEVAVVDQFSYVATYTVQVTNTGNVPLADLTVVDTQAAGSWPGLAGPLTYVAGSASIISTNATNGATPKLVLNESGFDPASTGILATLEAGQLYDVSDTTTIQFQLAFEVDPGSVPDTNGQCTTTTTSVPQLQRFENYNLSANNMKTGPELLAELQTVLIALQAQGYTLVQDGIYNDAARFGPVAFIEVQQQSTTSTTPVSCPELTFSNVASALGNDVNGNPVGSIDAVPISQDDLIGDEGAPELIVEKDAGFPIPVSNMNGYFDLLFRVQIDNPSDETVFELAMFDDLLSSLGATSAWTDFSVQTLAATNLTTGIAVPTNPALTLPFVPTAATNYLDAGYDLEAGHVVNIDFVVRFNANGDADPATNRVDVTGEDSLGGPVDASSLEEVDILINNGTIAVDKEHIGTSIIDQNTFESIFFLQVTNGSEDLADVHVTEDLVSGYVASLNTATVTDIRLVSSTSPVASSLWSLSAASVANSNNALVATADVLPANIVTTFRVVVEYVVEFAQVADLPIINTASADGLDPTGSIVLGIDSVEITNDEMMSGGGQPTLDVEKDANDPISVPGQLNRFSVDFTVELQNSSPEILYNLTVLDDIVGTMGNGAWDNFEVVSLTSSSGFPTIATPFVPNAAVSNWYLPGVDLGLNQTEALYFTVEFAANGVTGPFENVVIASGENSLGGLISTFSTEPVQVVVEPVIGLAKRVSDLGVTDADTAPQGGLTAGNAGEFDVTFDFVVENYGNVDLNDVQIQDDFATVFGPNVDILAVTDPVVAAPLTAGNPAFDGQGDVNMLAAGNTLLVGEQGTVSVTLRIKPDGNTGPFENIAVATGITPYNEVVDDISHDGLLILMKMEMVTRVTMSDPAHSCCLAEYAIDWCCQGHELVEFWPIWQWPLACSNRLCD